LKSVAAVVCSGGSAEDFCNIVDHAVDGIAAEVLLDVMLLEDVANDGLDVVFSHCLNAPL